MDYLLKYSLTAEDIDFLNETALEFEILSSGQITRHTGEYMRMDNGPDSGWRDYSTGARLVGSEDRAVFTNVTPKDVTMLTLKYHDRLCVLHNGVKRLHKYNIDIE